MNEYHLSLCHQPVRKWIFFLKTPKKISTRPGKKPSEKSSPGIII